MKSKGVIEDSCSPWSSPILLVRKKDGTNRFVIDYRKLNTLTKKRLFSLTDYIDEIISSLNGGCYFSSLDLVSSYWQIPMDEISPELTAFTCTERLFQFKKLPFGLCNAPATFQIFKECILGSLNLDSCLIYLDDVLIFGSSFEENNTRLLDFLNKFKQIGITLNASKCQREYRVPRPYHFGSRYFA